jgi:hypothetical protein
MRTEEPTWEGPYFGQFGVLADDGDRVQCHVCGDMFDLLGAHTNFTHGLAADRYRQAFGLMQKTPLAGPTFREKRRQFVDHLVHPDNPAHERIRNLTTDQRKALMAKAVRRREHDLHRTPPERTRAPLEAKYGDPRGHPDEFLAEVAVRFVEELHNGQRGVYRRLGDRTDVGWATARSRVMSSVKRGHLIWTGTNREPAGHLPGQEPWNPPGSFEYMFGVLEQWAKQHGHARVPKTGQVDDVKLGSWVQALRERYRQGTLSKDRVQRLEAIVGWTWDTRDQT